jgi:class III poly(R)-hydroxyalkanoic acid synthase PhaE subunit
MTNLFELGAQTWQSWLNAAGFSQRSPSPAPAAEPPGLIDRALALSQHLWLQGVRASVVSLNTAIALGTPYSPLEMTQHYWQRLYETTAGAWVGVPLVGPGREMNQTLLRVLDAWVQLYPAGVAYQGVLMDIQRRSFEVFLDELIALTAEGKPLTDWLQLQQIWSQVADQVFEQTFCSPDALQTRGRFINALNRYQLCQQDVMELYLTLMQIPGRREVDDIHHTLYELRKQVKQLQQALPRNPT